MENRAFRFYVVKCKEIIELVKCDANEDISKYLYKDNCQEWASSNLRVASFIKVLSDSEWDETLTEDWDGAPLEVYQNLSRDGKIEIVKDSENINGIELPREDIEALIKESILPIDSLDTKILKSLVNGPKTFIAISRILNHNINEIKDSTFELIKNGYVTQPEGTLTNKLTPYGENIMGPCIENLNRIIKIKTSLQNYKILRDNLEETLDHYKNEERIFGKNVSRDSLITATRVEFISVSDFVNNLEGLSCK